jgi:hypothetical protein
LEALIRKRGTVRLRKIDVATWGSPVSKQFGIRRLPTLRLYDGTKLVSEDTTNVIQTLAVQ